MNSPETMLEDVAYLYAAEKAIAKNLKLVEEPLPPGIYAVNTTVQIRLVGVLEQCEPQEYQATPALPLPVCLALLAYHCKLGRDEAQSMIGDVMREVFAEQLPKIKAFPDRIRDVERMLDAAKADTPKSVKTRAGALKWTGSATIEG